MIFILNKILFYFLISIINKISKGYHRFYFAQSCFVSLFPILKLFPFLFLIKLLIPIFPIFPYFFISHIQSLFLIICFFIMLFSHFLINLFYFMTLSIILIFLYFILVHLTLFIILCSILKPQFVPIFLYSSSIHLVSPNFFSILNLLYFSLMHLTFLSLFSILLFYSFTFTILQFYFLIF